MRFHTFFAFVCISAVSYAENLFHNSNYVDYEPCVMAVNQAETRKAEFPKLSPAPDGFTPVYLWHYGRHGSRYHYSQEDYKYIFNTLQKADSAKNLTAFGVELFSDIKKIYSDAEMRAGDLTPQGMAQHKGISRRMVANFPNLFADNAKIDIVSSTSVRSILSMNAFISEIIARCPNATLTIDASKKYMDYICHGSTVGEGTKVKNLDEFYAKREYKGDMFERIFVKPTEIDRENIDRENFVRVLYYMLVSFQGVDVADMDEKNCSLTRLFTEKEMEQQWQKQNIYWYKDIASDKVRAKNLLRKFIEEADTILATKPVSASLKFGHDTGLLPLVSLMNLDGVGNDYDDAETLHLHWQDYRTIPMAGNLQVVFYKNKKDETLVKFLLNEREVKLPIEPYKGAYYDWEKVREYLMKLI